MKKLFLAILLVLFLTTSIFAEKKCESDLQDYVTRSVLKYLYEDSYYFWEKVEDFFWCNYTLSEWYPPSTSVNNTSIVSSKIIRLKNGIEKINVSNFSDRKLEIFNILKKIVNTAYYELDIYEWYIYIFDNNLHLPNDDDEHWSPSEWEKISSLVRIDVKSGDSEKVSVWLPFNYDLKFKNYLYNHSPRFQVIHYNSDFKELLVWLDQKFRIYGTGIIEYYRINLNNYSVVSFPNEALRYFNNSEWSVLGRDIGKKEYCAYPVGYKLDMKWDEVISLVEGIEGSALLIFNANTFNCDSKYFKWGCYNCSESYLERDEVIAKYREWTLEFKETFD